jgi:excisionase family DNA binding protein
MTTATEKWAFSIPETALKLGVCKTTVLNIIYEGKLRYIRVGTKGGRIIIPVKALEEYLDEASKPSKTN